MADLVGRRGPTSFQFQMVDLVFEEEELGLHVFARSLRRNFDRLFGPRSLVRRLETHPERQ
jgi:hypothetical protein